MPPDKIIVSIVGIFTAISIIFGVVKYFINVGNKLDSIARDISEFKLQQKKQWEKIDRTKEEIRVEREKRIGMEKEIQHQKEITKEIKRTGKFRFTELGGVGGEE